MQLISLDDPAWRTTLPHLVVPQPGEWLHGLLLRCDEANHWESGTTLTYCSHFSHKRTAMNNFNFIIPSEMELEVLAQVLAIPCETLLAMTYHRELARIYGSTKLRLAYLNPSFSLQLCPKCLAKRRHLSRTLTLPHITLCPLHVVTLLKTCQCGQPLKLFHRGTRPFTCHICGMDWADLPQIEAAPERLGVEQDLLSWYAFFFSQATPRIVWAAANVVCSKRRLVPFREESSSVRELEPLSTLVALLVKRRVSPRKVMAYANAYENSYLTAG